jgi:purine-binding chemotaxis protein CheW
MTTTSLTKKPEAQIGAEVVSSTGETRRYLTFTLNDEAYALDIFHVLEILEHRHLTVVPMMPDFVRGVINLRGRAVPVIDLAIRFSRGMTTVARRTSIVIVRIKNRSTTGPDTSGTASAASSGESDGQDIGILVDTVNKVVDFSASDIEPPPAVGDAIHVDYMSGMARRDDGFCIVLDIDHILSKDHLEVLDSASTQNTEKQPDTAA